MQSNFYWVYLDFKLSVNSSRGKCFLVSCFTLRVADGKLESLKCYGTGMFCNSFMQHQTTSNRTAVHTVSYFSSSVTHSDPQELEILPPYFSPQKLSVNEIGNFAASVFTGNQLSELQHICADLSHHSGQGWFQGTVLPWYNSSVFSTEQSQQGLERQQSSAPR